MSRALISKDRDVHGSKDVFMGFVETFSFGLTNSPEVGNSKQQLVGSCVIPREGNCPKTERETNQINVIAQVRAVLSNWPPAGCMQLVRV